MKASPIQSIDIDQVDSLETYIFHLGLMCVSVQTLVTLQEKAESLGIFDDDETEASKTVKYQGARLFQCVDDLLRMCAARTKLEWPVLMEKIIKSAKVATNSVDSGSKSVVRKKTTKKRAKKK